MKTYYCNLFLNECCILGFQSHISLSLIKKHSIFTRSIRRIVIAILKLIFTNKYPHQNFSSGNWFCFGINNINLLKIIKHELQVFQPLVPIVLRPENLEQKCNLVIKRVGEDLQSIVSQSFLIFFVHYLIHTSKKKGELLYLKKKRMGRRRLKNTIKGYFKCSSYQISDSFQSPGKKK